MHDPVHDKNSTRHIACVFHQGNKKIQDDDIRKKNQYPTNSAYQSVNNEIFQYAVGHLLADEPSQGVHAGLYPGHRVGTQGKGGPKGKPHESCKNWNAPNLMGDKQVNNLALLDALYFVGRHCFVQRAGYECVLGISNQCLAITVFFNLFADTFCLTVSDFMDVVLVGKGINPRFHIRVSFQHLNA